MMRFPHAKLNGKWWSRKEARNQDNHMIMVKRMINFIIYIPIYVCILLYNHVAYYFDHNFLYTILHHAVIVHDVKFGTLRWKYIIDFVQVGKLMCRIGYIFCIFYLNSALSSTNMCRKCHVLVNTTEENHNFGLVRAK